MDQFPPGGRNRDLDWYTILVGVLALLALAMHGALWVADEDQRRSEFARGKTGWAGLVGAYLFLRRWDGR